MQPRDLAGEKRDAFGQFFDREQREVLTDLVRDLLARAIVFFRRHIGSSCSSLVSLGLRPSCQPPFGWLIRDENPPGPKENPQGKTMEKVPSQMTVIGISKPGGPEVLLPEQRAVPQVGPDEILIKVMAAGVNRPDVAQRSGSYPPPPAASDLP